MTNKEEKAFAESFGATSEPDQTRGRGWYSYRLNGWTIWHTPSCSREEQWTIAQLMPDRCYRNHQRFVDLRTALEFASTNPTVVSSIRK